MTKDWFSGIDWDTHPLYIAIAAAIGEAVDSGMLGEGDALPPQRELASRLGIAIGTVTRAYAEAERSGLVVAAGRRGTCIAGAELRSRRLSGGFALRPAGLIDLGVNSPSPEDDPDPGAALSAIAKDLDRKHLLRYAPPAGLRRHREAITAFLAGQGMNVGPERIVLTQGGQHAISVVFSSVLRPGDHIAMETFVFPGARAAAEARGLVLHPLPMDGEGLSARALDALCAKERISALYCVPSIQNPTAVSMSSARKSEIAAIARKRDFVVIEDEIHRPFLRKPAPAFASIVPERSFLLVSASKCVCGGLRVGGIAAPPDLVDSLADGVFTSMWSTSPLVFEVFSIWLEDGTVERVIERRKASNTARRKIFDSVFGHRAPAPPIGSEASPFIWLPLPRGLGRAAFVESARVEGVAVTASDVFAVGSAPPPEAVRISLSGAAGEEQLEFALGRLQRILTSGAIRP
ncbi:MAG: PLP-dependent aminotransferase family protein [Rectinemataceae bacterium]